MQRAKRGADFNPEILQHQLAHLVAVDPLRDDHAQHVVHLVLQVAEGLQPHRLNALQQRIAVQPVAGDAVIQPLLQDQPRAFASAKQRGSCFGVVVQPLRPPVVHHHAEIEVVGVDHLLVAVAVGVGANALLHALAATDCLFHPRAQGDRRRAGRAAEALLHPGRDGIQPPGVGLQRVTAERRGGIGVKQHVVAAADSAKLGERLQHGG